MKKKMTYVAPETEQMEVKVESGFLNISGGSGGAEASKMGNTVDWDSWD